MLKYLPFMCAIAYQVLERGCYAIFGGAQFLKIFAHSPVFRRIQLHGRMT